MSEKWKVVRARGRQIIGDEFVRWPPGIVRRKSVLITDLIDEVLGLRKKLSKWEKSSKLKKAHAAGWREMREVAVRLHETMLCKPRGVCGAERNATLTEYAEAIRALPDTPEEPTE